MINLEGINLEGIKNIFFDLGGVLVNLDREKCLNEFQKIGVRKVEEQIENSFTRGLFRQLEVGTITPEEFRNEIRQMTDKQVTDSEIDYAWNSFLLYIPCSKLELLLRLRKNYRVFMLSNTNKIHFDYMVSNHFKAKPGFSIDDYFEKCYLSYELHLSKPDKAIFEAIIKDSGALPQESLFLDDNRQNVEAARELGIRSLLVGEDGFGFE